MSSRVYPRYTGQQIVHAALALYLWRPPSFLRQDLVYARSLATTGRVLSAWRVNDWQEPAQPAQS
jgi:hypothetical protein